jgi:hypothetical protein
MKVKEYRIAGRDDEEKIAIDFNAAQRLLADKKADAALETLVELGYSADEVKAAMSHLHAFADEVEQITLQTLPSGRLLAICKDGPHSFVSIHDFEPKPVWPQAALERLKAALVDTNPPLQTNANIIKFPKYRRQCKGYEEVQC